MKAGFDRRVQEYKQQLAEFQANNEAVEALKKAHAKELAAHVQEHNKKYNELLTEKLNSEDALKAGFEAEKKQLAKEASQKLNEVVKGAREQEQAKAKEILDRHKADFNDQIMQL